MHNISSNSSRRAKLLLLLFTIAISTLLLLLRTPSKPHYHDLHTSSHLRRTDAIAAGHCEGTLYKELCMSTLADIPQLTYKTLPEVIAALINHTATEVHYSSANCSDYLHSRSLSPRQRIALSDCLELFDFTLDGFRSARDDLYANASSHCDHLQTLLSAAIANQFTCLDGFAYVPDDRNVRRYIEGRLRHVSHLVSNSLAMVKKIPRTKNKTTAARRREVLEGYGTLVGGFPKWLSPKDRRLLQTTNANSTKVDLVVAKDGSGNFTTIGEAVAAAPDKSQSRFVIYIKAGAYFENVEVNKSKTNLMFIGDGIGKTVVKASRNVVDGYTTFRSATVAVVGNGFLARGITIENSAGYAKHQAVALRTGADLSAFYQCSFVGYQDTLYVHSLRQFYRECDIYGTIDFIFGDAAVVFQNCNLYARKPGPNQKNVFTAQGREDPNENTGISIQNCKVTAAADLIPVQATVGTYLGRPWKPYSRTVYLQSYLDSLINPAGWLEWNGTVGLSTLYYGEYKNQGPGANTANRVNWPGFRVINSSAEASQFTVRSFIQGDQWLGMTSIPFVSGLN